jgi:hypothetical protein
MYINTTSRINEREAIAAAIVTLFILGIVIVCAIACSFLPEQTPPRVSTTFRTTHPTVVTTTRRGNQYHDLPAHTTVTRPTTITQPTQFPNPPLHGFVSSTRGTTVYPPSSSEPTRVTTTFGTHVHTTPPPHPIGATFHAPPVPQAHSFQQQPNLQPPSHLIRHPNVSQSNDLRPTAPPNL